MAILSVGWDVRMLWAIMIFSARAYLVLLFAITIWIIYSLWRISRSLPKVADKQAASPNVRSTVVRSLFRVDQLLVFLRLLFGVVLADAIFGTLRAVADSRMSLSEYPLHAALGPVTALFLVVCLVFLVLHVLTWIVKVRTRKVIP